MERNTADRDDAQQDGENLSSVQAEDARRREVEQLQAEHPERFGEMGRRTEGEELLGPDRGD